MQPSVVKGPRGPSGLLVEISDAEYGSLKQEKSDIKGQLQEQKSHAMQK